MSRKKYVVELTDSECEICKEVIGKLKGTSQKVRRAPVSYTHLTLPTTPYV